MAPVTVGGPHDVERQEGALEVADDWETRTNRDAPGDETWPMAQGHGEAELSSGRSAQTMLE